MKLTKAQRTELERLIKASKDNLEPRQVWRAAKNPKSPLHTLFKWDPKKQIEQYLEDRAREIIVAIKVEITVGERVLVVPMMVHNPKLEGRDQGYIQTTQLLADGDEDSMRAVLVAEFQQAAARLRRARDIAHLYGCTEEVDAAIAAVATAKSALMKRPPLEGGESATQQ